MRLRHVGIGLALAVATAAPTQATWLRAAPDAQTASDDMSSWQHFWGGIDWNRVDWTALFAELRRLSERQNGSTAATTSGNPGDPIEIPEPSNLLMLTLGVSGLVAGRYAARSRRKATDKG